MHNLLIANDIVEQAKKFGEVEEVTIDVGELAKATPNQIREGIAQITDWEIRINPIPAIVECKCGHRGIPRIVDRTHEFVFFECPVCNDLPKIIEGDQIKLVHVKVKD